MSAFFQNWFLLQYENHDDLEWNMKIIWKKSSNCENTLILLICNWFFKDKVGKIKFDKLDFQSISKLIFTACVACKNQMWNILKSSSTNLYSSNLIFQKSVTNLQSQLYLNSKHISKYCLSLTKNPKSMSVNRSILSKTPLLKINLPLLI